VALDHKSLSLIIPPYNEEAFSRSQVPDSPTGPLRPRRERPRRHSAAEQRDELAALQVIELHSVPSQGRIAGYRIGRDQSGGFSQPWRTSQAERQLCSADELASERPDDNCQRQCP